MKRKILGAMLAVALVVDVTIPGDTAFAARPVMTHYVATGDSVAAGQGAVSDTFGYAAVFGRFYRRANPGAQRVTNVAVRGETSASFLEGQLAEAVEVIGLDRTDVEVVTLTIGANDLLPLIGSEPCASDPAGAACQQVVGQALAAFQGNYQAILTGLVTALAADPGDEQLLVTTYYNPFSGTGSQFEPVVDAALLGADGTVDCAATAVDPRNAGLNDLIVCVGEQFGATTVDIQPIFDGRGSLLTHIDEDDTHPNTLGHRVIAYLVAIAYVTGR